MTEKRSYTLSELSRSISSIINKTYERPLWLKAELNKLNFYPRSGHCYPELVEKEGNKIIAQFRANLWKDDYDRINQRFIEVLKEPLKDGIKIMLLGKISFEANYGLSIRIIDIDIEYSLGDLEQERLNSIKKLKELGVFEANQKLSLPLLAKRFAIISVETSKGYADFMQIIQNNPWNYNVFHYLFPSLLQGEKAVTSISAQLLRIKKVKHHFDAVLIIRGGGGDIGLSCYNHLMLAKLVAEFPIPVLTGIGHATNETVVEMVAHKNAITPTKLAEIIIQQFHHFATPVAEAEKIIRSKSLQMISDNKKELQNLLQRFTRTSLAKLIADKKDLKQQVIAIRQHTRFAMNSETLLLHGMMHNMHHASLAGIRLCAQQMEQQRQLVGKSLMRVFSTQHTLISTQEKMVSQLDPMNVLKRGFTITRVNGKAITSIDEVKQGEAIETILTDGELKSRVEKLN